VAPPTRRELVIVLFLLVILLLVSHSNHQPSLSPHSSVVNYDKHNISTTSGVPHAGDHQSLRTRLSWGTSPVPQTKVLAHVPGRFSLLSGLMGQVIDVAAVVSRRLVYI
jgi:hypothetical protein